MGFFSSIARGFVAVAKGVGRTVGKAVSATVRAAKKVVRVVKDAWDVTKKVIRASVDKVKEFVRSSVGPSTKEKEERAREKEELKRAIEAAEGERRAVEQLEQEKARLEAAVRAVEARARFAARTNEIIASLEALQSGDTLQDFEEYLRVKVCLRLLRALQTRVEHGDELAERHLQAVDTMARLAAPDAEAHEVELENLDVVSLELLGKRVIAAGAEQLTGLWAKEYDFCNTKRDKINDRKSLLSQRLKELTLKSEVVRLSAEEETERIGLTEKLEACAAEWEKVSARSRDLCLFIGVNEGFVQALEGREFSFVSEEELGEAAMAMLEWERLRCEPSPETRERLASFANNFLIASRERVVLVDAI